MKKTYRDRALGGLYGDLQSKDFDVRENAIFQLFLMLRRDAQDSDSRQVPGYIHDTLPRELQRIHLSEAEQREIVDQLLRMIARHQESCATGFWVLSEVPADIGFAPCLALLRAVGERLDSEAAYQASNALRAWLKSDALEKDQLKLLLSDHDPLAFVERWAASADLRLASCAGDVAEILRRLDT